MERERAWTLDEVASFLELPPRAVLKIPNHELPRYGFGRHVIFTPDDVRAYRRESRRRAELDAAGETLGELHLPFNGEENDE